MMYGTFGNTSCSDLKGKILSCCFVTKEDCDLGVQVMSRNELIACWDCKVHVHILGCKKRKCQLCEKKKLGKDSLCSVMV